MFRGGFNVSKFNIHSEPNTEIDVYGSFRERLGAAVGTGTDIPAEHWFSVSAGGRVMLDAGIPEAFAGCCEMLSGANLDADSEAAVSFGESLSSRVDINNIIAFNADFMEKLLQRSEVSVNFAYNHEMAEKLQKRAAAGKDIISECSFSSVFNCAVCAVVLDFQTFSVYVSVPPGGELRVDSSLFTAILGDENVLHNYGGDWIEIKPGTVRLDITGNGGNSLAGQVLYNERYL